MEEFCISATRNMVETQTHRLRMLAGGVTEF